MVAEAVREAVLGVKGVLGVSPGVGYIEATYRRGVHVRGVGIVAESGRVAANVHLIVEATPLPALRRLICGRYIRGAILSIHGAPYLGQRQTSWFESRC